MDANFTQKLHDVYSHFSSSHEGIDGSHFARLCRDLNLELASQSGSKLETPTTFDLIFARAKGRGQRRLDFNQFLIALDLVGQKLNLSIEDVIRGVCAVPISDQLAALGGESKKCITGPERFFYDVSTYTGVQANRQKPVRNDEEDDGERVVELREIVDRDRNDKWTTLLGAKTPQSAHRTPVRSQVRLNEDVTPSRGPQRFYYDRNTYTGIHKHTPTRSTELSEPEKENPRPKSDHKLTQRPPTLPDTAPSSNVMTPWNPRARVVKDDMLDTASYVSAIPVDSYFESFMNRFMQPGA